MKTNTSLIVLCFALIGLPLTAYAQRKAPNKKATNLSLNLSIRQDSIRNTFLNLGLCTHIQQLKGFSFNVVASAMERNTNGMQIAGLANVAGKDANGWMLSGLANIAGGLNGTQISALLNVSGGKARGIQLAAIGNVGVEANGLQLAAISNIASKELKGMQLCGTVNIAVKTDNAFQLAGLANVCQGELRGLQLAPGNYAGEVSGTQIGLLNLCGGAVKGLQIGIINHSKDTTAHKLGLVNITPKTRIQMMLFAGNTSKLNIAARFKNRWSYTILGVGTHYLDLNDKFSGCLFYRAGAYYPLTRQLEVSGDLGYYHVENFENEDIDTPERMYSLQARVNLECRVSSRLSLFASGGYGMTRYYDKNLFYEKKPICEVGVILF